MLAIDKLTIDDETRLWYDQMEREIKEEAIPHQPYDEAAAADFEKTTAIFDNTKYQRENSKESCQRLSIPWKGDNTIFRPHGMSISLQYSFWQPIAMSAMLECFHNPELRGVYPGGCDWPREDMGDRWFSFGCKCLSCGSLSSILT